MLWAQTFDLIGGMWFFSLSLAMAAFLVYNQMVPDLDWTIGIAFFAILGVICIRDFVRRRRSTSR